ncbi:MAG: hypothetical protein IH597_01770 [Bacteroidales bacterium]|nr:hypothetical protein [Bacteroidales bacterium]
MKNIFLLLFAGLLVNACNSGGNKNDIPYNSGIHKGKVKEVIQTTQYTYLLVDEDNSDKWLALPKMTAQAGEVFYYKEGYEMVNFKSKELGRTFKSVYFIESVGTSAAEVLKGHALSGDEPVKAQVRKYEIQVAAAEDGINIANVFENKELYSGKTIKIKGQVVHYNPGIMNMNWIHLQDGSSFADKYDLTVTSTMETKVGQVITIEGILTLNKDFGSGYFYDAIVTNAIIVSTE